MNLFSVLEAAVEKWPEDTAVAHEGRSYRYLDLYSAAESLALKLRRAGIEVGDKVGVMCPSSPEGIVALFAVLRVDGIVVPISSALKAAEVIDLADELALDAFCYIPQFHSLIPGGDESGLVRGDTSPFCVKVCAARRTPQSERKQLLRMNVAIIRFTSGTTSAVKGIIVSHTTLFQRIESRSAALPLTKRDTILWLQPMAIAFGGPLYLFLLAGVCLVIADALDTRQLVRLIEQHRVTQIYAMPLFYRMMLNEKGITPADLLGVDYFISTGSSLPDALAEAFHAKFSREIVQYYGLAEGAQVLTNLSEDARKRGSVGKPAPGYEVKLALGVDDPCGKEAVGELLVRGPGLFDAYYKPWRLREEVLEDGWFRTGDLARRDADGYYWITGRVKDVINVAGVKVFPQELEKVLLSHPVVEEAVVFGAPEARFGEVPHAKVKLRNGAVCAEKELLRDVNDRLSVFKALRSVEFVDEIAKTVTGKPTRRG